MERRRTLIVMVYSRQDAPRRLRTGLEPAPSRPRARASRSSDSDRRLRCARIQHRAECGCDHRREPGHRHRRSADARPRRHVWRKRVSDPAYEPRPWHQRGVDVRAWIESAGGSGRRSARRSRRAPDPELRGDGVAQLRPPGRLELSDGRDGATAVPDLRRRRAAARSAPRKATINMGGGARWFFSRHLAFGFDVRFYLTRPEAISGTIPGRARQRLLILSAGVSIK